MMDQQRGWMPRCMSVAAVFWLLIAVLPATPLRAQFSGPALTLSSQPAQPLIPTDDPKLLVAHPEDLRIFPGDVLAVRLFEAPDFVPGVRVSVDGGIQLPLIGMVQVAGLTVEQAADAIAQRLMSAGMYLDPQVTVQLTEAVNQFATVTGELHAVVPLLSVRRLLDVLASASSSGGGTLSANATIASSVRTGGLGWPPTASHIITILREGEPKPIIVDLGTDPARSGSANIVIQPHDVIIIAKVGMVYVVGAFARQGAIPLDQNSVLTLMQATALSGGVGFQGRYEDLRVIRTEGLERKVVKVDIKRVLHGHDPDPVLQADDIVFLPSNALKAALKNGGLATLVGLADVAILAFR